MNKRSTRNTRRSGTPTNFRESLPLEVRESLSTILDYLWPEESLDYRNRPTGEQSNHIFQDIQRVERWLKKGGNREVSVEKALLNPGQNSIARAEEMVPTAKTLKAFCIGRLQKERVYTNVLRFSNSTEYGFQFWRWIKFRDGWKRGYLFQASDIERITSVVWNLEEGPLVSELLPNPQPMSFDLREFAPNDLAKVFESGTIRAYISTPANVEPFFSLRMTVPDSRETANWFYTSEIDDLQKVLREVSTWFRSSL